MTPELQALKQLVFVDRPDDFDESYQEAVRHYEAEMAKLFDREKATEVPVVRELVDYLELQKREAEYQLKTNRELDLRGRDKMFAKVDACDHFLSLFNGSAKEALNLSIKQTLDAAKD